MATAQLSSHIDGSERKQVCAWVQFSAARLLRRHVSGRAQSTARTRQMVQVNFLCGQCFSAAGSTRCDAYFCKAKVKNLRVAALGNENVCWFDVSMDDTFQVRSIQTVGHTNCYLEQRFEFRGPTLRDDVLQRSAVFFADVMNGADVGVVQCGRRLSFPSKPCQSL